MVCAARLGFSAPRPCGRVGWKPFPLHLQSSVVVARAFVFPFRCGVLRCLHVERQRFALSAALPDLPSAWTRSPAESRTLSLRRVSRRPVLSHQPRQRRCRPPLWASVLARRLRYRNVHHTDALLNQLMGRSRTLWPVVGSGQRLSLQVLPSTSHDYFCSLWFFDCRSPPARGLGRDGAGLLSQLPPPSPSSPALLFCRRGLRHCLARVLSGVASPAVARLALPRASAPTSVTAKPPRTSHTRCDYTRHCSHGHGGVRELHRKNSSECCSDVGLNHTCHHCEHGISNMNCLCLLMCFWQKRITP